MTEFTPWSALAGGALIGLASALLMLLQGRIAGLTGVVSGLLPPFAPDRGWRLAFVVGAVAAPALLVALTGWTSPFDSPAPAPWLVIGGLLVGVGVQFASGCTSGHGICGIARLSRRSVAATLTFMAATAVTVFVVRHILGGI